VPDRLFPVHVLATYDLNLRWQPVRPFTITMGGRNILGAKPRFALIDTKPFDASRYDISSRVPYEAACVQC
jgi:iron complex outermembrane recepter protein